MNSNKALNIKLGISIEECTNKIYKLYETGISQAKVAEILGVHRTTIENYFKRNKLKARRFDDRPLAIKHCVLSNKNIEVINGLLLGDGCLSRTSNLTARLVFSGNHLHIIQNELNNLKFNNWSGLLLNKPPGSKNEKLYKVNRLKSHSYKELLDIRNKWYAKNKKTIPDDLILTPITCYWWFIGDGCCPKSKKYKRIFICTDSFSIKENLLLIKKLNDLGFISKLGPRNRIYFNKIDGIKFLNYIKSGNRINKEYEYKFKLVLN